MELEELVQQLEHLGFNRDEIMDMPLEDAMNLINLRAQLGPA